MTQEQYFKNLSVKKGIIDVVIDSDAFTEIDDLYAISFMALRANKFNIKGIYAAPFLKPPRSNSAKEGMKKSYEEIKGLLKLLKKVDLDKLVFKGSEEFLSNEVTPVVSEAARHLVDLSLQYSPENPLYIIAIGAITNIASAMLLEPKMKENCVVIWLGGHATYLPNGADEYNMRQDIAAARVIFSCGIPLVHLPCNGVVDTLLTTKQELAYWLEGKNEICDYLYKRTVTEAEKYTTVKPWSRVIWDVAPVAWLLNGSGRYMQSRFIAAPMPDYDKQYSFDENRHKICSVYKLNRDLIFQDLFETLLSFDE